MEESETNTWPYSLGITGQRVWESRLRERLGVGTPAGQGVQPSAQGVAHLLAGDFGHMAMLLPLTFPCVWLGSFTWLLLHRMLSEDKCVTGYKVQRSIIGL